MQYNSQSSRASLWALLFGNFLIGTGVLLPVGLINQLSLSFDVAISTAGLMMMVSGLVVGIGAPIFAATTSQIDRRLLLVGSLLLYAVGHLAQGFVTDFNVLLALRGLTIVSAAIFTPQAAATVGLLVPQEQRSAGIAFIFIGWSTANVVGIPIGNMLGEEFGWPLVYFMAAALSLFGAAWVWVVLPKGLHTAKLDVAAWASVLKTPVLLLVMGVTLLSFSGLMVLFSYLAAILAGFGASTLFISIAFAVSGVAGLVGNTLASKYVGRFRVEQIIAVAICSIISGFLIFGLGFGFLPMALLALVFTGFGTFASNSLQQSRLVQIAPPLAGATVSLNTSAVYLGQAIGTGLGGVLIKSGASPVMAFVGALILAAALALSHFAAKLSQKA